MDNGGHRLRLVIHGPIVKLDNTVPLLDESLQILLSEFEVPGWHHQFVPITGIVHPYEENEVVSRLPFTAQHIKRIGEMDVFQDGSRYWLVDNRWGMTEIDVPSAQWRSWIIAEPKLDPMRVAEQAVLWPLAQLLRPRGLHLLPAVSAVREGFAVLVICPFGLEPELSAMINSGYKIIGQRWTALREEDGRLALLHMPGQIERFTTPRLRIGAEEQSGSWLDITEQHPGSRQRHAFCDAVLVAEPARRGQAHSRQTDSNDAVELLQREWPIIDLEDSQSSTSLASQLAQSCRCFEVQLSRNTKDLLGLLNSARYASPMRDGKSAAA
jgi:hypothetical protein